MSMELTKQRVDDTIINYFASRNKTKADKRHAFNTYCDFLKSDCKKFTEFAEKNSVDLRGYKSVSALNSAGHKNYENIKEMLDGQEFLQFVDNESRIVRGGGEENTLFPEATLEDVFFRLGEIMGKLDRMLAIIGGTVKAEATR